jgi:hypothetical protein
MISTTMAACGIAGTMGIIIGASPMPARLYWRYLGGPMAVIGGYAILTHSDDLGKLTGALFSCAAVGVVLGMVLPALFGGWGGGGDDDESPEPPYDPEDHERDDEPVVEDVSAKAWAWSGGRGDEDTLGLWDEFEKTPVFDPDRHEVSPAHSRMLRRKD